MKPHRIEQYGDAKITRSNGTIIPLGSKLLSDDVLQCDVIRQGNGKTPLPWHFTTEKRRSVTGTMYRYLDGRYIDAITGPTGVFPTPYNFSQREIDNVYNKALEDLNEQLRGNVDLSTDLGQISQTKRMLNASAQVEDKIDPIIKAVRDTVGRKARIARLAIGSVSDAYLEYKYGVVPLLQTIHDAGTVLSNMANSGTFCARGRGSLSADSTSEGNTPLHGVTVRTSDTQRATHRCEVKVWLTIGDYHPVAVQLSSMNPISIAWELMPWSFVVDWFVNMSGYMRAIETAIAYDSYFHSGYKTVTEKHDCTFRCATAPFLDSGLAIQPALTNGTLTRRSSFRLVLSSYPMPNRPSINIGLGSGSLMSVAALLGSKLR